MIWTLLTLCAQASGPILGRIYPWGTDALAQILGSLIFDVLRIRRTIVLNNLAIAFPDLSFQSRLKLGRSATVSCVRVALEFLASRSAYPKARVSFEGEEHLDQAIASGQGTYAILGHLGNWELMNTLSAQRFLPPHVVVKDVGKGKLAQWVDDTRAHNGMCKVERSGSFRATAQLFRILDRGELIGFLVDQRRTKGQVLPFFGRNSHTNDSLMRLWMKRQAPVIPVSVLRTGAGSYVFRIRPPLNIRRLETTEETVREGSLLINQTLEAMIREAPEQYFWHHRRWKGFETQDQELS
jgi:KDO2-lipid IV(A) lauroyltransferase